eukprot:sb/3474873/
MLSITLQLHLVQVITDPLPHQPLKYFRQVTCYRHWTIIHRFRFGPFLNNGVMNCCFKQLGTDPSSNDLFHNLQIGYARLLLHCFRTREGMQSGGDAEKDSWKLEYCVLYLLREILNFQESQVKSFETHFRRS